jgi:hypothetical protein
MAGMKQVLRLSWSISNNGYHNNNKENSRNDNNSNITMTKSDNKTRLQALALINDCYKSKMDLTTNGVVILDAIKFVLSNKEKLTMSKKEDDKESSEPDYDEDKDQLEEKQEDIEKEKTNNGICHYCFGM